MLRFDIHGSVLLPSLEMKYFIFMSNNLIIMSYYLIFMSYYLIIISYYLISMI